MKVSSARSSESATTLVELVLALGILAIAMVSLLGMLSRGVGTMKKASDIATESRIVQQLIDEVQAIEWDRLDAVVLHKNRRQANLFFEQMEWQSTSINYPIIISSAAGVKPAAA